MRLIIYCDESISKGKFYSNFYGGALIKASDQERISKALQGKKDELNIFQEIKWSKTSSAFVSEYIDFIDKFFEFIEFGEVKMRVMFTQNINQKPFVQSDSEEYFVLYYHFIKLAFGLSHSGLDFNPPTDVAVLMDNVPHKNEDVDEFKNYLSSLSSFPLFTRSGVSISKENIAEIDSKDHNILQAVDLILGAMQFRLNDKHKQKSAGSRVRGKKTRAKEKLYKHINSKIRGIKPNFNIGVNTGRPNGPSDSWNDKYRHWLFVPSGSTQDNKRGKKR